MSDLMGQATDAASLTFRQRALLVTAAASALGDSYCSLSWGKKLAAEAGPELAATVIRGADDGLDARERALVGWARSVATDPNAIDAGEVQGLRDAGFDETQIFAITTFVALRLAFSTVNDALGAAPDAQLGASTPAPVLSAVTFGRPLGRDHARRTGAPGRAPFAAFVRRSGESLLMSEVAERATRAGVVDPAGSSPTGR
jgi:alkylhydroperoxidase/carboxymuconolactone decarboxylase family protein YurZ